MSLLSDYEQRTAWKYEPIRGTFPTHEGLARKVGADGRYLPFPGSTVVFRPGKQCLQIVQIMQELLHHHLQNSEMLASPLPASTIHLTLHDLISPEMCASEDTFAAETEDSIRQATAIVEEIRRDFADQRIMMVADRIVSMVSKSLVLMLKPQTERDYALLMELYHRFDAIQPLPYPLTPHITLSYFKPGMIDGDALGAAVDFAQICPENAPVFAFNPEGITVQRFLDMKTYADIPERICFCCDGGLNRSVLAANILNHLARERHLPILGEARAAYPNTKGWPVSDPVWQTLESHGIAPDRTRPFAQPLEDEDAARFTSFAGISESAMDRISRLGLPKQKTHDTSRFFFGVRDPEYGEIPYDQAFSQLYARAERYLESHYEEQLMK